MRQISLLYNTNSRFHFLFLYTLAAFTISCGTVSDKEMMEGVIEYDAVPIDKSNPMATMAPSKMIVKFKANKASVQMSAAMGLFNTMFITEPETKSMIQQVKFLGTKLAVVLDSSQVMRDNRTMPVEIEYLNETKIIAGYKCKKARITPGNKGYKPFDVYYTEEIGIDDPNFATHFYPIKGVLMEYRLIRYGLELKFTATKVKKENIKDSEFMLSPDYKLVSEQEMTDFIMRLQ